MPKEFNIAIADLVVKITAMYDTSYDYCLNYITNSSLVDFYVSITETDLSYEREKSINESIADGRKPFSYSNEYLEILAIYRKIAEQLVYYNILLFHGSTVAVDGEAYLFTAQSGIGKSTHAKLWCEYFGKRAIMVNDDKPLLKITDDSVIAYGTPWNGKHRLGNNISAPVRAIAFLAQNQTNHISKIDKHAAFPVLYRQSFRPQNTKALLKILELVDMLSNKVALYDLKCNMNLDAVEIAYNEMHT